MRVSITPVTVDDVTCSEAEVSIAISNSVAIRVVPVGPDGTTYDAAAVGIVGTEGQEDVDVFMSSVRSAASVLMASRGV